MEKIYDVFISYRRSDGLQYAQEIYEYLVSNGLRVFLDKREMDWGDAFDKQLEEVINCAPHYILIATKDAFTFRDVPGSPAFKSETVDYVHEEMKLACELTQEDERRHRTIHVLNNSEQKYIEENKLPEDIRYLSKPTWQELGLSNHNEVLETLYNQITAINRMNIWYASQRWYENSEEKRNKGTYFNKNISDDRQRNNEEYSLPINVITEEQKNNKEDSNKVSQPFFKALKKTSEHVFLIGQGGIGKTTALLQMMQRTYEDHQYTDNIQIPIFVDLSFAPDSKYGDIYKGGISTFIRRKIFQQVRSYKNDLQANKEDINDLERIMKMDPEIVVNPVTSVFFNTTETPPPEYLLLLDGLNEVSRSKLEDGNGNATVYMAVVNEIIYLITNCKNVQVVLTSRSDEKIESFSGIKRFYMTGINEKEIIEYFNYNGYDNEQIKRIVSDRNLMKTLKVPLFLIIYSKLDAENAKEATSRGEILDLFFRGKRRDLYNNPERLKQIEENVKEYSDKINEKRFTADMYRFILDFILPELAWKMEKDKKIDVDKLYIIQVIKAFFEDDTEISVFGEYGQEAFKDADSAASDYYRNSTGDIADAILRLCSPNNVGSSDSKYNEVTDQIVRKAINVLGILQYMNNRYEFVHQHIRDYFAAVKYINTLQFSTFLFENDDEDIKKLANECIDRVYCERPVSINVRRFIGEILGEHHNMPKYVNGKCLYGVPDTKDNKNKCYRNLIDRALCIYSGKERKSDSVGYGIYTLVQILKEVRKDLSGITFSGLDFKGCSLNGIRLSNNDMSKQKGLAAKFTDGCRLSFDALAFNEYGNTGAISPDGTLFATIDTKLKIWSTSTFQCLKTIEYSAPVSDLFPVLLFSDDGKKLVVIDVRFIDIIDTGSFQRINSVDLSQKVECPNEYKIQNDCLIVSFEIPKDVDKDEWKVGFINIDLTDGTNRWLYLENEKYGLRFGFDGSEDHCIAVNEDGEILDINLPDMTMEKDKNKSMGKDWKPGDSPRAVHVDDEGNINVAAVGFDGLKIWRGPSMVSHLVDEKYKISHLSKICFDRAGKKVLWILHPDQNDKVGKGEIEIFDIDDGCRLIKSLSGTEADFIRDGELIVYDKGRIKVWNSDYNYVLLDTEGDKWELNPAEDKLLVFKTVKNTENDSESKEKKDIEYGVSVWDIGNGEMIGGLSQKKDAIVSAEMSKDGSMYKFNLSNGWYKIWDRNGKKWLTNNEYDPQAFEGIYGDSGKDSTSLPEPESDEIDYEISPEEFWIIMYCMYNGSSQLPLYGRDGYWVIVSDDDKIQILKQEENAKPEEEIDYIPGLYAYGCNLRKVQFEPPLTKQEKERLIQNGVIV